jgi:hypothetical protein
MMGITIYAWGRIERIGNVPRLIEDLKDVAGNVAGDITSSMMILKCSRTQY